MNSKPQNRQRLFGLDLLRAVGILLVVFGHGFSELPFIPEQLFGAYALPGIIAVELFFVLSGFLIGEILIRDFSQSVSFAVIRKFWMRRWLRTLPSYYAYLVVAIIIALFVNELPPISETLLYLIFSQNLFTGLGQFYGQSWTLSVEEWFYFLLPIVIYAFYKKTKKLDTAIALTCLAMIIGPLLLRIIAFIYHPDASWRYIFRRVVIFRLDATAVGVTAALLKTKYYAAWNLARRKMATYGSVILILAFVYCQWSNLDKLFFGKTILFTIISFGCALLLPYFETFECSNVKIRKFTFFVAALSYNLYLCNPEIGKLLHSQYLSEFLGYKNNYALVLAYYWIMTFALAYATHRLIERPILNLREIIVPGHKKRHYNDTA